MTDYDVDPRLAQALSELDEDAIEGLYELAESDPDLLAELLDDVGYLPTTNAEARERMVVDDLPDRQAELYEAVSDLGAPKTAEEIVDHLESDHPAYVEAYQSARHRPWVSTQLNDLVDEGVIGRFRDGRVVCYVPTTTEAVRHWALHNSRFVEELTQSDARTIADDTGMPVSAVRNALDEIQGEDDP
jgi:hypothetical protein